MGYSRKKSTPPRRMGSFFNPPSHLDFLKPKTPLPVWISKTKDTSPAWISGGKNIRLKFNLSLVFDEKLKKSLKNTKWEGVKVNKLFTFFPGIIPRNNRITQRWRAGSGYK